MRINLQVPYAEKDAAKRLGARWDMARKVWYIVNQEDLTPFMPWLKIAQPASPKAREKAGIVTKATSTHLPSCSCTSPPWEDCEHTEPPADERFLMLVNCSP